MKKIVVVDEKYLALIWPYSDSSAEILQGSILRGATQKWGSIAIGESNIVRPALSADFEIFGLVETGYSTDPEIEYDRTGKFGPEQIRSWWNSLVQSRKKILLERFELTSYSYFENPQPTDAEIATMWADDTLVKLNYKGYGNNKLSGSNL